MTEITYKDSGVDIDEGARAVDAIKQVVSATYTPEVIGDIGGFGSLFSAAALKEMDDPILVSGIDGVGTKLELAKRLGDHSTAGIDLVAMCANDILRPVSCPGLAQALPILTENVPLARFPGASPQGPMKLASWVGVESQVRPVAQH